MKNYLLLFALPLVLFGCDTSPSSSNEQTFVVVDRDTNKVLSTHQYDYGLTNPLVRTEAYDDAQRLTRVREYAYDDKGYVRSITEVLPDNRRRVIEFVTQELHDASGRLVGIVQVSSLGDVVETFYGYDDTGELRGVVVQTNEGSVTLQDYDDE